ARAARRIRVCSALWALAPKGSAVTIDQRRSSRRMRGWERRFFAAESGFSTTFADLGASAPFTTLAACGFSHGGLRELARPSQRGRGLVQPGAGGRPGEGRVEESARRGAARGGVWRLFASGRLGLPHRG